MNRISDAIETLEKEFDTIIDNYEDLEHENIKLKEEMEEKDALIDELKDELRGVYEELAEANTYISSLEQQLPNSEDQ